MHNAIYEAEKSLFQKMEKASRAQDVSEAIAAVLVDFVKTLFKSRDQVEQTRIKAAEAAAALASSSNGKSEPVRTALIDWISSAKADERSVPVQQSLDHARRAIADV